MTPSIRDVILKTKHFFWTDPHDVNHDKVFSARTDDPHGWKRPQKTSKGRFSRTSRKTLTIISMSR
jgi:hypothetical protein